MGQRNNGKRRREKENDGLVVKIFMNFDKFSLKIEELLVQSFSVCPWIKGVTLVDFTNRRPAKRQSRQIHLLQGEIVTETQEM